MGRLHPTVYSVFLSGRGVTGTAVCRTHTSCLLWEVPLREVLALLRQHPNLYQLASQQALPNHYFGEHHDKPISANICPNLK